MTISKGTKVVHIELSLQTLSWSLTVSLRQESSTTASGSAPGINVDTIMDIIGF